MLTRTWPVALLGLALASSMPVPAEATYPGRAGRLAFGLTQPGSTSPDIYSVRPDGTRIRQLTDDPGFDACAAYDATGRQIAFCSNRTGALEIWTMRADGAGERQLTRLSQRATFPDFAPDGRRIAFTLAAATPGALADIWTIRSDGRRPRPLTTTPDADDLFPAWSPDGRRIVFLRRDAAGPQLWTMDRHGRHQRQLTFDPAVKDQVPDWRPDGQRIAYIADNDIWLINPDGSGQVNLTNTPTVPEYGTAWSPDGRRIAYLDYAERRIYTVRSDGTDRRSVGPATGVQFVPGWQPQPGHGHR